MPRRQPTQTSARPWAPAVTALAALLAAAALAGCGGDGEAVRSSAPPVAASAPATAPATVGAPPGRTAGTTPGEASPPGALRWTGDFETGDLDQWRSESGDTGGQAVASDRLRIVEDPVVQGRYALRVEVRRGDAWRDSGGDRAELVEFTGEDEGDERWYSWSTMFDEEFPSADEYQIFTQWHATSGGTQPPVIFGVAGEEIYLKTVPSDEDGSPGASITHWSAPLERGVWHRFAVHVRWSSDPDEGFVELWYDGARVLPPTPAATLIPGQRNYLKQGLYRDDAIEGTAVLYHDGMTETEVR